MDSIDRIPTGPGLPAAPVRRLWEPPAVVELPRLVKLTLQTGGAGGGVGGGIGGGGGPGGGFEF